MRVFFLLALLSSVAGQDRPCGAGQRCVSGGDCESFRAEKLEFTRLPLGSEEKQLQREKLSSLVCNEKESRVCCDVAPSDPDSPSYLPSLEREECGLEGGHAGFILGGEDTRLGEFPFLALLGRTVGGNITQWICGGSIINKWFVLSAGHCGPTVDYVRLGEWTVVDPEKEGDKTDCETVDEQTTCSQPYQDIAVAEVKTHPDYGLTAIRLPVNDIMLLRLSSPAQYNTFVQPVCLPSPSLGQYGEPEAQVFGNNLATVVGWGRTSNTKRGPVNSAPTDVQQKLNMRTVDYEDCVGQFRTDVNIDLSQDLRRDQHLCAGGEIGLDSCKGDSGGPLLARKSRLSPWQLVGVVSGGTAWCGIGAPGLFTRVTTYNQWVRENLN